MPLRKLCCLLVIMSAPLLSSASVQRRALAVPAPERQIWKAAVHDSQFAEVAHTTAPARCEATQPPEALATPNPLLAGADAGLKVTVSFIIGTDGQIHSPLILDGAGPAEGRAILQTVRSWRYRPARCNGVPTEAEGKIEFFSR